MCYILYNRCGVKKNITNAFIFALSETKLTKEDKDSKRLLFNVHRVECEDVDKLLEKAFRKTKGRKAKGQLLTGNVSQAG